jgi:three-Cys-motif partner protein
VSDFNNSSHFLFPEDGMPSTAAEKWVRAKVSIVRQYLSAYVALLAGRVDDIIFVDLYAGNGMYSIGAQRDLFPGSALMSLSLDLPITKFVFCDPDISGLSMLKIRVNRYFRNKNVILLDGKPEELIERLSLYVPRSKGNYRSAVLCLCDPFSLEIPFDVVSKLGDLDFSFLVPFTFPVNEKLDHHFYLTEHNERLKKFLGPSGSERLEKTFDSNVAFYKRLVRIYENNLLSLGFNSTTSVHKLDSGLMELPLYYIGFFSRVVATKAIQQDVEAAHHIQFELFKS